MTEEKERYKADGNMKTFFLKLLDIKDHVKHHADSTKSRFAFEVYNMLNEIIKEADEKK